jgi:hypothetical protein
MACQKAKMLLQHSYRIVRHHSAINENIHQPHQARAQKTQKHAWKFGFTAQKLVHLRP